MIDPDALLAHAEQLGDTKEGPPSHIALRRGVSAAYNNSAREAFFTLLTVKRASFRGR